MLAALSLLDDTINQLVLSGMDLDDRQKHGNLIWNNVAIESKFLNYDYSKIWNFVNNKLSDISKEFDCKILYVAERSSHVWGTSHIASDNDVKAIVYYRAKDYYSPIKQISKTWKVIYGPRDNKKENRKKKKTQEKEEEKEGKKEQEPDVELNCIELTKIGQMIIKNDPNVFEIFTSPLPYFIKTKEIIDRFQEIIYSTYNWYKLATHYLAWSNGNHKQLTNTKKSRIARKPLKILFVVWRGILSAEWLINHKKCKGLPLYIPDLITYSRLLNNEQKKIMMGLLTKKLRKSYYKIDCDESRDLVIKGKEMIGIVNQMMEDQNPNKINKNKNGGKGKHSIHQRVTELRKQTNIIKGDSNAKKLEKLVFDVIESFI